MASAAPPELLTLQQVVAGRYSIQRELGRGGMGIVFLARDVALERLVAIKLLPPHLADDEQMHARFVREAKTAARLSHPNIVPIHSVEEHGDIVFFVMGFVDGETLTQRVRRAGPLNARDGSKLLQELAWALAYAHSAGVIHRDVKPDNVLIDRASARAVLTDFGIARVIDSTSVGLEEILGTAQFMSPEQAAGGLVDRRSDLYSLGVTAFYALTGRLPFESPTLVGFLGKHLTEPAPPLATVRDGLPPKLAAAVDRCLAKNPADRFATGEEMADAIGDARAANVEIAPMVRAFLRDRTRMGYEVGLLYTAVLVLGGFAHEPFARAAGPLSLLAIASVARLFHTARGLLSAGHSFEDVRVALQLEAAAQDEERVVPKRTTGASWRRRHAREIRIAGLIALGAGLSFAIASLPSRNILAMLVGAGSLAAGAILLGWAGVIPPARRRAALSLWLDRLWQGWLGRWFFKAAALPDAMGRDRQRDALGDGREPARKALALDVVAPTEVSLLRASEELFDTLPRGVQAQLGDARNLIGRLRTQIAALRAREEEFAAAIAQAGESHASSGGATVAAGQALVDRRADLASTLESARREAASQRVLAVAALENIHLQLLRLRTGLATPAELTADLEAAQVVERQINPMIDVM
jgi:serine/threonine-protein kinase